MTSSRRSRTRRDLLTLPREALEHASRARSRYYLKIGRTAMACQFEVFLRPEDRNHAAAVHEALDEIDALEDQMSVYREWSELSRLNRSAALTPVAVEKRLYGLLRRAEELGCATGGAFDITAGPLVRAWGFFDRAGRLPAPEEIEAARARTGWRHVYFDNTAGTVAFRREGVELNLGSIGKGYALDRAAGRLRDAGLRSFLIHAGHSSILAAGDSISGPGWEVSLRDPRRRNRSLGSVRLSDRALSTSGTAEQSFEQGGRRYGHILDPRTGWPASCNALVSVAAPDAATAEALSTAFFVMSGDEVREYCLAHPEVASIVLAAAADPPSDRTTGHLAPTCWGITLKRTVSVAAEELD